MFADFKIIKKCKITNARVSTFELAKNTLHLPIYIPVATYGAMRGVPINDLEEEIILSNTYHLRMLDKNVKTFMGWNRSLLTDSGGFQIQSLPNVKVVDEGVIFNGKLFTPENSMEAQMTLGADIMMQLDDVVNPKMEEKHHIKAISRSIEWLDRAIIYINSKDEESTDEPKTYTMDDAVDLSSTDSSKRIKKNNIPEIKCKNNQVIFPIIQGGLIDELRMESLTEILLRKPKGVAIGGLSGGENKNDFCKTVYFCCKNLPDEIPRYLMGVGYPEDVVVCCALGTDMSDCVYPTRTARFGRGFSDDGDVTISNRMVGEVGPISKDCECLTCSRYSRSYLALLKGSSAFCMLMSRHNLYYMRRLTSRIRESILNDNYPEFIKNYMERRYKGRIPDWIRNAMKLVNVELPDYKL